MFFAVSLLVAVVSLSAWYLWAGRVMAQRRRAFAGGLAALVVIQPALHLAVRHGAGSLVASAQTTALLLLVAVEISALPLLASFALGWLWDRAWRRPAPAAAAGVDIGATSAGIPGGLDADRRRLLEAAGGAALLATSGSLLGWGMVRGRHEFQLAEVPVRIAGLPRALDGYVIAQVSDIHTGLYVGERELDEGLALVRAARPDLIVATGDLVDFDASFAPLFARKLAELPARDGVVAILGNHDYYAGAGSVAATMRAAGVTMLVDEGRRIRASDGGGFALLGVNDRASLRFGGGGPDLARALATVPSDLPRILLSHQPQTVDLWAGTVALQLSGHTHGGQINPGINLADMVFRYVAGSYSVRGTTLYVNRGFGTVGPPARVGAPPEVTRIVLVAS
jgi:predicted MPP superfamily phosphohydrolase